MIDACVLADGVRVDRGGDGIVGDDALHVSGKCWVPRCGFWSTKEVLVTVLRSSTSRTCAYGYF